MEIEKHSAAEQNENKIIKKNSNILSIDLKKTTTITIEKYRRPSIVGSVSSSHNSNAATSEELSSSS